MRFDWIASDGRTYSFCTFCHKNYTPGHLCVRPVKADEASAHDKYVADCQEALDEEFGR